MLSCYCRGMLSLDTVISVLLRINTGRGIVVATSNVDNALENKLIGILLVILLAVVIIFVLKKRIHFPKWFSGGIVALKGIFSGSEENEWIDNDSLDEIIEDSGYLYDSEQDIYYSHMNPWQRKFGYCRIYDEASAPLGMIIDCEPIYFEYDGKRWLIEFWKGQYDLTTGCEIGIYTTEGPDLDIPGIFNGTFYNCASDSDRLLMSYSIKKNNEILFIREDKHWWLTGFKLGEFSKPSELTMDINITLKNWTMRNAFIKGLKNAGYSDNEIIQNGNTVSLKYSKPHVPQPFTRTKLTDGVIQWKNKKLCKKYHNITKNCESMPCKIEAIRKRAPKMFGLIFNMGKTKKIFENYIIIENFLDD